MAVVSAEELVEGRGVSGSAREANQYTRSFLVRTDDPATSLLAIANSTGLNYGDRHPDDASAFLLSFDAKPISSNPLLYRVSFKYGQPTVENGGSAASDGAGGNQPATPGGSPITPAFGGLPTPSWAGGTSMASVGTTTLPMGPNHAWTPAQNSAGVPLTGIEIEEARQTLSLTTYRNEFDFLPDILRFTNVINSDTWAGSFPRTWLCKGCRWNPEVQTEGGVTLKYYKLQFDFEYRPLPGWVLKYAMSGFQQLSGGKLVDILQDSNDSGSKPVTEPQPLDENGVVASTPYIETFYPHAETPFTAAFGDPF